MCARRASRQFFPSKYEHSSAQSDTSQRRNHVEDHSSVGLFLRNGSNPIVSTVSRLSLDQGKPPQNGPYGTSSDEKNHSHIPLLIVPTQSAQFVLRSLLVFLGG